MKLVSKYKNYMNEYYSELTKELDKLAGIEETSRWKHYIFTNDFCKKNNCLAIRVPGGTVGEIDYDENNVITKISIDTNYVVKTYPNDVNDLIKKFVGETIEISEV